MPNHPGWCKNNIFNCSLSWKATIFFENLVIWHASVIQQLLRSKLPPSWGYNLLFWVGLSSKLILSVIINSKFTKLDNAVWDCYSSSTLASWSSGNAFVSGAGGLRFKSRAGKIGQSVVNGSPPLRHFFEKSCVARAQWRVYGPRRLVTLQRNTASIMKKLVCFFVNNSSELIENFDVTLLFNKNQK